MSTSRFFLVLTLVQESETLLMVKTSSESYAKSKSDSESFSSKFWGGLMGLLEREFSPALELDLVVLSVEMLVAVCFTTRDLDNLMLTGLGLIEKSVLAFLVITPDEPAPGSETNGRFGVFGWLNQMKPRGLRPMGDFFVLVNTH